MQFAFEILSEPTKLLRTINNFACFSASYKQKMNYKIAKTG